MSQQGDQREPKTWNLSNTNGEKLEEEIGKMIAEGWTVEKRWEEYGSYRATLVRKN